MFDIKNIEKVIEIFINKIKEKHNDLEINIEGILLFGSACNPEKKSKKSDIDLYLVIKNIGKRLRGIMIVEDQEIDYFINPIEQLKSDYQKVKDNPSAKKTILFMLVNGLIIKDTKEKALIALKNEAHAIVQKINQNEIPNFESVFMKYFIRDFLNDIDDSYEEKNYFALQVYINQLLEYLIEVFCQKNKILQLKAKYQKEEIEKVSPEFVSLYEDIAKELIWDKKIKKVKKISNFVLDNLGGQLEKEWELVSPLDI